MINLFDPAKVVQSDDTTTLNQSVHEDQEEDKHSNEDTEAGFKEALKQLEINYHALRKHCADKKSIVKLNITNKQVNELREIVASHPLVLQKWVYISGHKMLESKLKQDESALKIRKLFLNDLKNKPPKSVSSNFAMIYQKGLREEFKEWTSAVDELANESKGKYQKDISNCTAFAAAIHLEKATNDLIRSFIEIYLK